jgi:release factor glutamine methyltransferase
MTINQVIAEAVEILRVSGIQEPLFEARSLMAHAIDNDRTFIFAHPDDELDPYDLVRFREFIARRKLREPFQYIVGKQEFYGLDFVVTPDVLIPRPETEILVEAAIDTINRLEAPMFLEIGTGSGCISISILKAIPTARGIAIDISTRALEVSRKNAETHLVGDRLTLLHSDLFESVPCTYFDVIVSNPPYIASSDIAQLQPEVRDFEPIAALTDGRDGTSIIQKIVDGSANRLVDGGRLLIEIGYGQSSAVKKMFSPQLWRSISILEDLQKIPRTVIGTRN